ncbi:hypothetical protein Z517_10517 [Fonsecaea pedrosoi CBS 271.37]|uniref:Unplaced genomic scaffold supercont1.7, whole genome shotgun sequence n=1 Tax=Fonsecaea pedrosoi CBS 271.37 TaxID=1442368 RepID=A0A0D2GTK7_9EURO|nr:uncharacterized protein Z517_10517 [Fonsecaea pedrosoi CBS 271.37]KIW75774.1 hypothetical protein Z517_10517 [Fonsecaea pedrosoi CBS 271.37]
MEFVGGIRGDIHERNFDDQKDKNFVKGLATTPYKDFKDRVQKAAPGTCEWIDCVADFRDWLQDLEVTVLMLMGRMACGKTVLAKHLIDRDRWGPDATICYFFFNDRGQEFQKLTSALRAMLHQLFTRKPALIRHARPLYNENFGGRAQTPAGLRSILFDVINDPECGNLVCILDALNECSEQAELLQVIRDLCTSKRRYQLKLILTSRPRPKIYDHWCRLAQGRTEWRWLNLDNWSLKREVDDDIKRYIQYAVHELATRRGLRASALRRVEETMLERAGSTYLWANGTIRMLENSNIYTQRSLEALLSTKLPTVISQVYHTMIERSEDRDYAMKILSIACAATRPLTWAELHLALTIKLGDKGVKYLQSSDESSYSQRIVTASVDLLHITEEKVHSLHWSLRQFLLQGPGGDGMVNPGNPQLLLATSCIADLLLDEFATDPLPESIQDGTPESDGWIKEYLKQHPFLEYAAESWASHLSLITNGGELLLPMAIALCDTNSGRFRTWFRVFWSTIDEVPFPCPREFSNMMVASFLGLEQVVAHELDVLERASIDIPGDHGWTALICAAHNGHGATLNLLLEWGGNPYFGDGQGRTAIHHAAFRGKENILRLMVEHRFNLSIPDANGCTPLHLAAMQGHEEVLSILLDWESSIDDRDDTGRTALHYAASNDQEAIVRLLLAYGADPDLKDHAGRTARDFAVEYFLEEDHQKPLGETASSDQVDLHAPPTVDESATVGDGAPNVESTVSQPLTSIDLQRRIIATEKVENVTRSQRTTHNLVFQVLEAKGDAPKLSNEPIGRTDDVDSLFSANVVDIKFSDGVARPLKEADKPKLRDIVNGKADIYRNLPAEVQRLRWLHLPANNLMMQQYESVGKVSRAVVLRPDLWIERLHKASPHRPHACFLTPFCESISMLSLMPYIHWEKWETFVDMRDYVKSIMQDRGEMHEADKHKKLIWAYLNPKDGSNPIHLRRTLDQYYYFSLDDTSDRDGDQVTGRLFDRGDLVGDKVLMMVDQLWLWVVGDMVFTSFPQRWSYQGEPHERTDIARNIETNSSPIRSTYEFAELIIGECLRTCLDPSKGGDKTVHFFEHYEMSIGAVTNKEAQQFEKFSSMVENSKNQDTGHDLDKNSRDFLDIRKEVELLKEVKDIRDELHTLLIIFQDQQKVLQDLKRLAKVNTDDRETQADSGTPRFAIPCQIVDWNIADIKRMDDQAARTLDALNHLVDLKQKHASLLEARWARDEAVQTRRQAEETARQGNTIMVFTIVTIVFLPLSFIAAFFAINIVEFPKDPDGLHLGYVSKYMFSISAAIIIPLILIAFNVNEVAAAFGSFGKLARRHSNYLVSTLQHSRWASPHPLAPNKAPVQIAPDSAAGVAVNVNSNSFVKGKLPHPKLEKRSEQSVVTDSKPGGGTRDGSVDDGLTSPMAADRSPHTLMDVLWYVIFVLPLGEVHFALRLLGCVGQGPGGQEGQVGKGGWSAAAAAAAAVGVGVKSASVGVEEESSQNSDEDEGSDKGQTKNKKSSWRMRRGPQTLARAVVSFLRLCLVPLWTVALVLVASVFTVVYVVVTLLFDDSPIQRVVRRLMYSGRGSSPTRAVARGQLGSAGQGATHEDEVHVTV